MRRRALEVAILAVDVLIMVTMIPLVIWLALAKRQPAEGL